MSDFGQRLKMVPTPAWMVGVLLTILILPALVFGPLRMDPEVRSWPVALKAALAVLSCLFVIVYPALVGFIYADARRRRMRHVLWAWLALVPYFIGVIVYFIMRDPLPTPCPHCGTDVPRTYPFCPGCGTSIHPVCSRCGKILQRDWMNCPHCGLPTAPPSAA
jgi:RNA polymerase subunit RPABC4/transcription elongation factor Spt4